MEERLDRDSRSLVWAVSSFMSFASAIVIWLACWVQFFISVKLEEGVGFIRQLQEFVKEDQAIQVNEAWLNGQRTLVWVILFTAVVVFVVSLILSVMKTGRKMEEGGVHLTWFDRIYSDVQIAAGIAVGSLFVPSGLLMYNWTGNSSLMQRIVDQATSGTASARQAFGYWWYDTDVQSVPEIEPFDYAYMEPTWVELFVSLALAALATAFILCVVQSLARKLKDHCFWRRTVIGAVWVYVIRLIEKDSDHRTGKTVGILILAALLCATWIGTVVVIALILVFVPKWMDQYNRVREGVDRARAGDLYEKIEVEDQGELSRLAEGINAITEAQSLAVANELKTQRMRTDLISNVSHDLKTPLTSMVSYVDLLKEEGLESDNASEYLEIIDEKTSRLQKLTEDLFEAAKASSGDIPVNLERIEMGAVVNQALVELDENLEKNHIQVIYSKKTEEDYVMADGKLFWRIIDNLLTNVGKYALPYSRAYIDISDAPMGNRIRLEVKNISREPLNIDAEELMERFKRGDCSRNTEGSGLGLAIARDLTNLMGGCFNVSIDGDLFKATVEMNRA